jgi:tetratricopeptide (TPR) repeat protein
MSAEPVQIRPALRTLLVCVVLFAGTVLLFSRGLTYDFSIYDDPSYVTNNEHVQAGLTWASVQWAFVGHADYWHPLTWLSHMLDWQVYGANAAGHHLTSLLWHGLNAVLAFLVLRRLTGAYAISVFCAALFAWHPLRVESVQWVTERKDVMSGCFFLLTLWAYAAYARARAEGRPAAFPYAGALALFVAGLMSKPMLVSVPVVLLLLDLWPLRRATVARADLRTWVRLTAEKMPFVLLSAVISAVTLLMQVKDGAFVLQLPFSARVANAFVALARYLGKVLWPFNLSVCYPHPGHWPIAATLGGVVLVAAISWLAWRQRERRPWIAVGWLWFLVMLLPTLGLVQVGYQAMADRYTYAPVLGLQIALVWSVGAWIGHAQPRARLAGAVGAVILVGCAWRTWDQQRVWRSSVALFEHAVAVTGDSDYTHGFLGYTYLHANRPADAVRESRIALRLNPTNDTALYTLAAGLDRTGATEEAIRVYKAVLERNPNDGKAEYPLGLLLLARGHTEEALPYLKAGLLHYPAARESNIRRAAAAAVRGDAARAAMLFELAVGADPDDDAAYVALGSAQAQLGRVDEAIGSFRAALKLDAKHPEAHTQLGLLLLKRREPAEAAEHFRAALQSDPQRGLAYLGLGRASEQLRDIPAAVQAFARAAELAPDNPLVCRAWAQALARGGKFSEAATEYEKAVRLDPRDASAYAELGYALLLSGRREDAARAWRTALRLDPALPGLRERLERLSAP